MNEMKNEQEEQYRHEGHPHGCMCWRHTGMHGSYGFGFWILRLVFGLAVLLVVFWLGVKIGEVKTYMRQDGFYGGNYFRMNMTGSPYERQGRYIMPQPMMVPITGTTQPAPATSTPKSK